MSSMATLDSRRAAPLLAAAAAFALAAGLACADAPSTKSPKPASPPPASAPVRGDDATIAASVHLQRAVVLTHQGSYAEAEKELVEADRLRPDYGPGLIQLSNTRYRLGKKAEAKEALERAIRRGSAFDDKTFLLAARIFSEEHAFAEGQKKLQEWGGNRPLSANFHAAIGLLKLGALELGPCEIEFRRALDLDPANDAALGGMFQLYSRVAQYEKLQPFLDRGLKAKPDSQMLLMLSGNCLMAQEHWAEAKSRFEQALAKDPKNAAALVNRGSALHHLGDAKAAIEDYRRAIGLDPKGVEAPVNLATALEAENRAAEARDVLLAARQRGIEDLDVLNALTVAYDLNNEIDKAIAVAKESLGRDANQPAMNRVLSKLQEKKSAPAAPAAPRTGSR
jgi:tetratricopeptide (TPR) repeat protein